MAEYGVSLGIALYHEWVNNFVGFWGFDCVLSEEELRQHMNDKQFARFLDKKQIRVVFGHTEALAGCQYRFRRSDRVLKRKDPIRGYPASDITKIRRAALNLGAHTPVETILEALKR